MIDEIEVGSRVAGPVRIAIEVADSPSLAERLVAAGAEQLARPGADTLERPQRSPARA